MPSALFTSSLLAAADAVQHRVASRLLDGFAEWWELPATITAGVVVAAIILWMYRRDAAELSPPLGVVLTLLRLAAVAAVALALLDVERIAEHEIVLPSRVAVLVDSSASMSLVDQAVDGVAAELPRNRSQEACQILDEGGLLEALATRHEVSIWRFDADAEPLTTIPLAGQGSGSAVGAADPPTAADAPSADAAHDWQTGVLPRGYETRLGEALNRVLDREPAGSLAGVILLSDGGNNAGLDPLAPAAALAKAGVSLQAIGIGSDILPANVRVADLIVPPRVFPGDGFAVTAYLQQQGLENEPVRVELWEQAGDPGGGATVVGGRLLEERDAVLAADGDLTAVRFDVPGLATPGRRSLVVRVRPPAADRSAADDIQTTGIEVVDRVTQVLLLAGGPGREYQFMRNVLDRDPSFAVDVLLGTAQAGISQDARRILAAFPPSDEALADYDVVVAIDVEWLALEPLVWSRLERWVARASGGLILVAGGINMEAWLSDERATPLRGLFPVELRRPEQVSLSGNDSKDTPLRLEFTRDGLDAEFLWLADSRAASAEVWGEFPGVYACYPARDVKPGATVYAKTSRPGGSVGDPERVYLAGQYYGAGSVFYAGSGELWRLRGIEDAAYERLVAQIVRHVSQGRLSQGSKRARLLVDRDRHPVGGTVQVRLALADEGLGGPAASWATTCSVIGPEGELLTVPLAAEPGRPGTFQGGFVVPREGTWRIEVEPPVGSGEERLVRRVQVQLPDRELARPRLDRPLLEQLATRAGGGARFPGLAVWTTADSAAVAAALPDRSRREYEPGVADPVFKQRLNAAILAAAAGFLGLEWIVRRLAKLA